MPSSSPHDPATPHPIRRALYLCSLAIVLALPLAAPPTHAQTLAHPGWVGNGIDINPWWQRALFYQVEPPQSGAVDFKALAVRLDALRSLGVDALLLPAPELPPPGSNGAMPDLDSLDELLRQAGSHDIRVVLTIHAPNATTDLSGLARFWLNRGIAGLHIATPAGASPEQAQAMVDSLRKLTAGTLGQRILLTDLDLAQPATANQPQSAGRGRRRAAQASARIAELQIDPRLNHLATFDAATLRPLLAQTVGTPNLLLDLRTPTTADADAVAAIAILIHPSALIDSSANLVLEPTPERTDAPTQSEQPAKPAPTPLPPGTYLPYTPYVPPARPHQAAAPKSTPPDPLTTWYGQLSALHSGTAAIHAGSKIFLDFDSQNALVWVNRPASPSLTNPPVVVACNLSGTPVKLSLEAAMKSLNLHGSFLRPLLRSYDATGAQNLDSVTLPPHSVFIGELRR
jgi:hypothetical protein